jgi:hypothetical protein
METKINYLTDQSDIKTFKDFVAADEEKELGKVKRSFNKNPDGDNLANINKKKFNKVTKKWDDITKDDIIDAEKALDEIENENVILSFEEFIKTIK